MRDKPSCKVCVAAQEGGKASKNNRLNVSSVIRFDGEDGGLKNILIDCGKTFYTAARRWAVPMKLGRFEGVLLTHGHADAMLGLDDLRHWTGHGAIQDQVDIWADAETMKVVNQAFPYLVDPGQATGGGFVSDTRFNQINGAPFTIASLDIRPLYVEHGACSDGTPYMCLAFLFDHGKIAYLSDVSRIPDKTMTELLKVRPEVLVLDCLREQRPYKSHFILKDSLAVVQKVRPRQTFLVGMTHDIDHDEFNRRLASLSPDIPISVAHDGLVVRLEFDDETEEISSI